MYLRKIVREYKGKVYMHYLLVESIHTLRGPRQRVICSLGDLKPKSREEWLRTFEQAVNALRNPNGRKGNGSPPNSGANH
jgi:hypothetical protein